MRKLIRFAVIPLAAIGLLATLVVAQSPMSRTKTAQRQTADSDEVTSRGIRQKVREGNMDGMELVVFDAKDGKLNPILDPSRNFREGDEIKVQFWSSFDGYVYFVNVDPGGTKKVIYPVAGRKDQSNMIRANQQYMLPRSDTFEFAGEKGVEVIQVIMSRQPIPFFDDAVRNSNGELGKTASNAAAELVSLASRKKSGIDTETIASVLPRNGSDAVLSREVRLAPPRDKSDQGTVIAIPEGLKDGVAVVEIRLKHI